MKARFVSIVIALALCAAILTGAAYSHRYVKAVYLTGAIADIVSSFTMGAAAKEFATIGSVSLTSPTLTVDVTSRPRDIAVTTNVSQTGCLLTGGTTGQIVRLWGTSDTATTRWDDNGSTLALGGNITLGVDDVLEVICTSTSPQNWKRIYSSDN